VAQREEEGAMAPPAGDGRGGAAMQDGRPGGQAMREDGGAEHAALETGAVTDAAFAVTRGLGYLAIALAVGGAVFLFVVWLPALSHVAGGGSAWLDASERFARIVRWIVVGAVLLGLAATAGAIVLQAATATGASFWTALDADAVDAVSDTRPVRAWLARLGVWLVLGITLLAVMRPRRLPGLRRAALGATGAAPGASLSRPQVLLLGGAIVALALSAPLGGHSGTYSPSGLLVAVDTLHVLAVSAWLGGLAMVLFALPISVRALDQGERLPLVAAATGRFSRLAMSAVALLLLSGIVQSIALVGALDAFVETAYGRLVLAKIVLFLGLDLIRLQPAAPASPASGGRGRGRGARAGRAAAAPLGGVRGRSGAGGARARLGAGDDRAGGRLSPGSHDPCLHDCPGDACRYQRRARRAKEEPHEALSQQAQRGQANPGSEHPCDELGPRCGITEGGGEEHVAADEQAGTGDDPEQPSARHRPRCPHRQRSEPTGRHGDHHPRDSEEEDRYDRRHGAHTLESLVERGQPKCREQ
jgi:putative copper export protein